MRIKIIKIESPTFGGRTFGAAGTYEKIIGKEYCEVNPSSPKNSIITDIEYAQKNKDGLVSYSMDFYILKPVDERKGNHKLFFEINNRGGEASGQFIPFAKTKAQRLQMRDPRLSLEERYGTHEGYVDTVKKAVASLEKQRLLLKEDGDKYVEDAEKSSILK